MRSLSPRAALLGLAALGLIIKLTLALTHDGYLGVDGGAYLLSYNSVLGQEPTGTDFARPPLAPGWLLVPFVSSLGTDIGLKVFHVLASLTFIYPFWLLARRYLTPWQSVAATYFIMTDLMLTEMFVVGPLPMIGFSFLLLAMWAISHLAQRQSKLHAGVLVCSVPLIAYTNQTAMGIAAIMLPIFTLSQIWLNGKDSIVRLFIPTALAIALTLTALPWYINVAPNSGLLRYPGPLLAVVLKWADYVYLQFALGLGLSALIWRYGGRKQKALIPFLLACTFATPLYSYDESVQNILYRSKYLWSVPFYISAVWIVGAKVYSRPAWRPLVAITSSCIMLFLLACSFYVFTVESKRTQMVTPATARAIQQIDGTDGTIVTNSYSMALYVAALSKHPVTWTQVYNPPAAYRQQHYDSLCIFNLWPCNLTETVERVGATYALAETRWPSPDNSYGKIWLAPRPDTWEYPERAEWLEPIWEQGTTKLWRISDAR